MCLIAKSGKPRVAERDIECVKVLNKRGGIVLTPYRRMNVTETAEKGGEIVPKDTSCTRYTEDETDVVIGKGFIHAFLSGGIYSACLMCEEVFLIDFVGRPWEFVFHECVIPKGTRYYVDETGSLVASERMRVGRDVSRQVAKVTGRLSEAVRTDTEWCETYRPSLLRHYEGSLNLRKMATDIWRECRDADAVGTENGNTSKEK